MAIDTAAKRRAARRHASRSVFPSGTIGVEERHYVLGSYYLETTALELLLRPCVTLSDISVVLTGSDVSVSLSGANRSVVLTGEVLGCSE